MLRDQLILSPVPVSQIVHIGAGLCDELSTYLEAGPDNIILTEPNPEAITELTIKIQGHENVELIPAAISGTAGRAQLQVLNFADLSSLRWPTGLIDLLPGVRVDSKPTVDTLTFESLCEQLPETPEGKSNWLIIEASGEELVIAKALIESDNTKLFQNIMIRCGKTAWFEGGSAAPEVLHVLREGGYQLEDSWLGEDPDWPYFHLSLDIVALENTQLKTKMAGMQAKLNDAQTKNLGLEEKLSEVAAATNREKEAAAGMLQELQALLDAQTIEQGKLKKDLGIALRLQMLAHKDHQDLQARYRDVLEKKGVQEELLIKLTQKLGDAAGHLHQLSDQGIELELPSEPPEDTKPTSAHATKKGVF